MSSSFTPHLDRRYQLTGAIDSGHTRWWLPFNDEAVNCLIVGDGYLDAGTVYLSGTFDGQLYNDFNVTSGFLNLTANTNDYTAHECTMGVLYTMEVEPTRPFYKDREGNADFVTRIGVRHLDVAYYQSSGFRVRRTMTNRPTCDKTFVGDGTVTQTGKLRAHLNGNATAARWSVLSLPHVPKRVVIPSIRFDADANARRDG